MDSCNFPGAIRLSSLMAGVHAAFAAPEDRMSVATAPARSSFENMSYLRKTSNDRCGLLASPLVFLTRRRFLDARSSPVREGAHHSKFEQCASGTGFSWMRVKFFTWDSNGPKPLTFRNSGVSNAHRPATSYIAAYLGPSPIETNRRAESQPGHASRSGKCLSVYQALKAASCAGSISTRTIWMKESSDIPAPSSQLNIAGAARRADRGCDDVAKFGQNRQQRRPWICIANQPQCLETHLHARMHVDDRSRTVNHLDDRIEPLIHGAHRFNVVGDRRLPEFDEQVRGEADEAGQYAVATDGELGQEPVVVRRQERDLRIGLFHGPPVLIIGKHRIAAFLDGNDAIDCRHFRERLR